MGIVIACQVQTLQSTGTLKLELQYSFFRLQDVQATVSSSETLQYVDSGIDNPREQYDSEVAEAIGLFFESWVEIRIPGCCVLCKCTSGFVGLLAAFLGQKHSVDLQCGEEVRNE